MQYWIETAGFVAGLGFSLYVYWFSIRKSGQPPLHKLVYFVFTAIGITGTLWLAGILIAHFLRKWGHIPGGS